MAGPRRIEGGEIILAGGAINTPQLLQLCGRRARPPTSRPSASRSWPTCRASARTSRTTSRSTSSTRALQPVSMQPSATQMWRRPFIGAQWLFLRSGPGATNHFEGGGFARSQRRRRLPEPDVPLPAAGDPLRRECRGGRARLPGPRRADVLRRPRHRSGSRRTDPHDHPALRFNYLSTEQDRREWVEAVRVARAHPQPAGDGRPTTAARRRPGRSVTTDDEIRDWVARDAETALHPSCTARMGVDGESVARSADDARPRSGRAARRRRLGRCRTSPTATSTRR